MRVVIFSDTYLPDRNGVATSIKQIKEQLEFKGHSVYIFSGKSNFKDKSNLKENIYKINAINIIKKVNFRLSFPNKSKMKKIIKKIKPDIIHTHSEFIIGKLGKKIALDLKIPLVHTNHTMWEYYVHYIKIYKYLKRFIKLDKIIGSFLNDIRYFIYPSIKAKNKYFPLTTNAEYKIIPNGVNFKVFKEKYQKEAVESIREEYKIKKNDKVLIFVGRLSPEKRILDLLNSLKNVFKENENYKLLIIGRGTEERETLAFIKSENLENQMFFIGAVPWDNIYNYYKLCDAIISLSISEVHPMTIIEGLMSGIPAIVINDEAYTDTIKNNYNGIVLKREADLYYALKELFEDEEKLKILKDNALKSSKNFSIEIYANKIEEFYKEIVEKNTKN